MYVKTPETASKDQNTEWGVAILKMGGYKHWTERVHGEPPFPSELRTDHGTYISGFPTSVERLVILLILKLWEINLYNLIAFISIKHIQNT